MLHILFRKMSNGFFVKSQFLPEAFGFHVYPPFLYKICSELAVKIKACLPFISIVLLEIKIYTFREKMSSPFKTF